MERKLKKKVPVSLYRWGWLGLFPLVGGISGLILLIRGLFKYEDVKLSVIGLSGILFTIIFYTGLFYFIFYSDANGKHIAKLSVVEMKSLITNIEYYKIQNGKYPDNLETLLLKDKFAPVYDPLMMRGNRTTNNYFNYKLLGKKYLLFSSGIDKIPYTSDDLYPDISDSEITKIGLLKQ